MKPKQLLAQTERNIQTVEQTIKKAAEAIGGRFGDIDNTMVRAAAGLQDLIDSWAAETRSYMNESIKDGFWDPKRHEGLGV